MHTYQAANNIFAQNLSYPDHVHNIHVSFLHYQPVGCGKEINDKKESKKSDIMVIDQ